MANTRQVLNDRFIVFNSVGKKQSAQGVGLANSDLDLRIKAAITRNDSVTRREIRDCKDQDLIGSEIQSRFARYTLALNEVTPQLIALFSAWYLGASASPTGTPADEIQTLARTGTVSGGTFTIALTLEGRTVTTKAIAWNASTADIQSALTAARMLFIQPGSVTVGGDWTSGITLTFVGNLAKADIPAVVIDATNLTGSTPGISVTESTKGVQRHHVLTRATTRVKPFITFALGWDNVTNRVEKYIDYVVDNVSMSLSLDGNVTMNVGLVGPWEYDSIETAFTIPSCSNIDPLQAQDCRVSIDSVWQTTDINSLSAQINDNVPTDRLSAFPFDGIDIQNIERGRQPSYGPITASIFGSETDSIYDLAQNERTEAAVPVILHFGFPGDRVTWNFPSSTVRFQTNRLGEAGEARYSIIQIEAQPESASGASPFNAYAEVAQSTQFLT